MEFMDGLLDKVFTEYGLAFAIMLCMIIFLIRDKNMERTERQRNLDSFLTAVAKQTEAIQSNTTSISNLNVTLSNLAGRISHGN